MPTDLKPILANCLRARVGYAAAKPFGLAAAEVLWSGLPVIAAETGFLTQDIIAAGTGLAIGPRYIGRRPRFPAQ